MENYISQYSKGQTMLRSREGSEAKKQQYEIIGDDNDEEFAHKNNPIPRSPQKFSQAKSREEKI